MATQASAESAEAQAARENVRRIIGRSAAAEEDPGTQPAPHTSAPQLQDDDFEAELGQHCWQLSLCKLSSFCFLKLAPHLLKPGKVPSRLRCASTEAATSVSII